MRSAAVFAAALAHGVSADMYTIQTPYLQAAVTVTPQATCLSQLQVSLTLAGNITGWAPNLVASSTCAQQATATALESPAGTVLSPAGGTVTTSNGTSVTITGIGLGSVAVETWELSISNAVLSWGVSRSYTASGVAVSDQFPALWLQTTTVPYEPAPVNDTAGKAFNPRVDGRASSSSWQEQVQIPSFLGLDSDLLDTTTQMGYKTMDGSRVAVLGDSTIGDSRRIMLSPAGIALHLGVSECRFAMYRPASVFVQTIGLGAECAGGPGNAYSYAAGETRITTLTADFRSSSQGHGYFDFGVPGTAGADAQLVAAQATIMAQVYTMPMGWIFGNSPQCETCIHEASVFPQLQGMFRLESPPGEAPVTSATARTGAVAEQAADVLHTATTGRVSTAAGAASCPPFSNPFCGVDRDINTVTVNFECAPGSTIASISAGYGTPTVIPNPDGGCTSFVANASCNDPNFQAYAVSTCVGQARCSLTRVLGDFDPCPNVEKTIVATAYCNATNGGASAGGRQSPAPGACPTLQQATAKHISFLLANSVNASGIVAPRWSIVGGNDWSFGGIIDQFPHMVLAAYYHAMNTNDTALVASWMPTLDTIAGYMLTAMSVNGSGLLTNTYPACQGLANVSLADNFWDDVRFGWHDAIVGAYAVDAFRGLADLKMWLGDAAGAAPLYTLHQRMITSYNAEYWSDALGGYHDWVDVNGAARSYFYTWQQYAAIEFGIASPAQASTVMATAQRLYAAVESRYNLTKGALFCPPTNLIPLDPSDLTVDFDDEYEYGHYENGCIFHWMCGLEIMALGRVSGPDAAYQRLLGALTVFNSTRLWGQRWGWLEGTPLGSDVITDSLFLLYGGLQGALNIRTSLLGGVQTLGPAAAALEGATFTFGLGGSDVTVTVKNGFATVV